MKYVSFVSFRTRFYAAKNITQQSGNIHVENTPREKIPMGKLNRIKVASKKVAIDMINLQPTGIIRVKTLQRESKL